MAIVLPLVRLWCERDGGRYWPWDWTARHHRQAGGAGRSGAELLGIGVDLVETDDWSIHLGPLWTSNASMASSTMSMMIGYGQPAFDYSRRYGSHVSVNMVPKVRRCDVTPAMPALLADIKRLDRR